MPLYRTACHLALVLIPSLVASELITITEHPSTCTAIRPSGTASFTSCNSTFNLPVGPSSSPTTPSTSHYPGATSNPHVALCPEHNGQNYTYSQGGTYSVHCDIALTGTLLSLNQRRQSDLAGETSEQMCITACRDSHACVALNISPGSCQYFSHVTGTADAIGSAALIKLTRLPANASTTSSASPNPIADTTTTVIPNITLPNNLGTQFGGVDVTQGFQNPDFIRQGLWNLGGLDGNAYESHTVYYGANEGQWTFQVPEFLSFSWASQLNTETITGETKSSYQKSLSRTLAANFGFAGFGLEVQNTFEEDSLVETYHKYASVYSRQQIYRVGVLDLPADLQSYLSDRAVKLFASGNAKVIVDTFGTHYMTAATFGGMQRFASSLDARDEEISTKLGQALKMSVKIPTEGGEVTGGTNSGNTDQTVEKIRNSMEIKSTIVFGGTYIDGSDTWIPSLYRNPSAVNFELGSIADLILDPTVKKNVRQEIDRRLQTSAVTSNAKALVMWESLGTKKHVGWKECMSVAHTNTKQGWYTLGQYMARGEDWAPELSKGLLIRDIPNSAETLVKKPDDIERRWGHHPHWGMWEMTNTNFSYHALSGFFYNTDAAYWARQWLEGDRPAMLHDSLVLEAPIGDNTIWTDAHSGAHENAFVYPVVYGSSENEWILQLGDKQPDAYFFHTNPPYVAGSRKFQTSRKLDFSKVQFVSNRFINPA